jgi:hypothetical protein
MIAAQIRSLAIACFGVVIPQLCLGQEPCRCKFDTNTYSAEGTKAACNAFMYNNRNCEIAFSALGGSPGALPEPRPDAAKYRSDAYSVTLEHVAALEKRDFAFLSSEPFLRRALPLLMRAAYARDSVQKSPKEFSIAELDKEVMSFLKEETPLIARIFSGRDKPQDGKWGQGHTYSIGVGFVRFSHAKGAHVIAVVFPEDRR